MDWAYITMGTHGLTWNPSYLIYLFFNIDPLETKLVYLQKDMHSKSESTYI